MRTKRKSATLFAWSQSCPMENAAKSPGLQDAFEMPGLVSSVVVTMATDGKK